MTEPVLPTAHAVRAAGLGLGRSLCAGLVALTVALALPSSVWAAPATGPTSEGPSAPSQAAASEAPADAASSNAAPSDPDATGSDADAAASDDTPSEAAIRSALDDGDLTSASELARARSQADPTPDNLALEAEVWLALADYEQAKRALDRAIEALPADAEDDRAALEALRDEVEAASRGTRADEPASTHREQLDRQRAERLAALAPATTPPSEAIDEPKPREPIVKKWYFWVTLGAIVATAGAIVGVAVSSSISERNRDSVGGSRAALQPAPGGLTIRF